LIYISVELGYSNTKKVSLGRYCVETRISKVEAGIYLQTVKSHPMIICKTDERPGPITGAVIPIQGTELTISSELYSSQRHRSRSYGIIITLYTLNCLALPTIVIVMWELVRMAGSSRSVSQIHSYFV
jgi:hypothetical protein